MRFFPRAWLLCGWLALTVCHAWALLPPRIVVPPNETGPAAAADRDRPVIIGCWNLEWFPGRDPRGTDPRRAREQVAGVRQVLAAQRPAVLFACEVRGLAELRHFKRDYPFRACTEFPRPAGDEQSLPNQGLAILSRRPWTEIWALDFSGLPAAPNRPARGLLGVKFAPRGRPPLTLYGVHLKSNFGDPAANRAKRAAAIDYLEWDWQRRGLDPARDRIVILGDFNSSVHDPVFARDQTLRRLFALGFTDAADGLPADRRVTIPASGEGYPDNDFDHILVSPALRALTVTPPPWVTIVPVPFTVSDHYPLFLDADVWF
ncbi:MAG: endonuclease/exonuclease/phosphatase family protein [Verrucomicrobiales bacterium]|jgi:endonuclease/exonuclease/phosphatase family metal-dependent hydrolase|nr:endonuclease/exonuclease/phosphatase family protein [Verrucomicrobiales bacterium]